MIIPSPITTTTSHHALLAPRGANEDGTTNGNLSNSAIIIIVLVSSGFLVVMGYAITRFFFTKEDEHNPHLVHDEQMQYMHSLRRRNLEHLKYSMGMGGMKGSQQQDYHYADDDDVRSSGVSADQSSHASKALSP
jgi:hypothetical protein